MKKKTFIMFMFLFVAFSVLLTSCDFMSMFGGETDTKQEEKDINKGHYLEELYTPKKVQAAKLFPRKTGNHLTWFSSGAEMREEYMYAENIEIGGVEFHNVYEFNSDTWLTTPQYDTEIIYELPSDHNWKSLCYAVGAGDKWLYNCLDENISLKLYLDGKEVSEEYFNPLTPVRYFSYDITGVKEIKFYSSKRFDASIYCIGDLTIWEEANHSIAPTYKKATQAEDFFDNTKKVYRYNYPDNPAILHELEKTSTVDGTVYNKGVIFSPSNWGNDFDAKDPYKGSMVAFNTFGRYKYLHFQIGHVDKSEANGALHFVVMCDGKVIKHIHIADTDIISTYCIDIDYGHIVSIQAYPDRQVDENQKDVFRNGTFGLVNVYGSPSKESPITNANTKYKGSYKLLSEYRKPYNFVNALSYDESLFLAESKMLGFQMGGEIYNEGMVMRSVFNVMTSSWSQVPARADFNLDGNFKYLTFKVGRHDRSAISNDILRIYCDDVLKATYELQSIAGPISYELQIDNCSKLSFELEGKQSTNRGTYGIFDIAVHTDQISEVEFYHTPNGSLAAKESYPENTTVTLMKDIRPYESLSALGFEDMMINQRNTSYEYIYAEDRRFNAGGESHELGFILKTGKTVGLVEDGSAFGAMLFINAFFLLNDVKCSSFAAFTMNEQFDNLHFDVCSLDGEVAGQVKTLVIIGDGETLLTQNIISGSPIHIDVNIHGVKNLVFFLEYGEDGVTDSFVPFAFYNLTATNY